MLDVLWGNYNGVYCSECASALLGLKEERNIYLRDAKSEQPLFCVSCSKWTSNTILNPSPDRFKYLLSNCEITDAILIARALNFKIIRCEFRGCSKATLNKEDFFNTPIGHVCRIHVARCDGYVNAYRCQTYVLTGSQNMFEGGIYCETCMRDVRNIETERTQNRNTRRRSSAVRGDNTFRNPFVEIDTE